MFKLPVNLDHFRFEKKDIGLWLTLLMPLIFHQTTLSFLRRWSNNEVSTYAHGGLLALIAFGILISNYYNNREQFNPKTSFLYLPLAAICLAIWLLATISYTEVIAQISLILFIAIVFCYFYGYRSAIYIYTTIALLLSVTPIWSVLNTTLRLIATYSSSALLSLTGFTNFRDGFLIHIPVGIFHVDTGCSGLSQFVVAIAISFIYAWYVKLDLMRTAAALIMAVIAAIIANIIRIYIIIVLGQLTNMQHYFVTVEHISLGWIVFAVFMYIFFILSAKLLEKNAPYKTTLPINNDVNRDPYKPALIFFILCLAGSLYASFLLAPQDFKNQAIAPYQQWQSTNAIPDWQPTLTGAGQELHTTIKHQQADIDLHIYFYSFQSQDHEAVNNENKVADENWQIDKLDYHSEYYNAYRLRNQTTDGYMVLQNYWVNNKFYKSPVKTKMVNSLHTLKGNTHIAFVAIGANEKYADSLKNFSQLELDNINIMLDQHSQNLRSDY